MGKASSQPARCRFMIQRVRENVEFVVSCVHRELNVRCPTKKYRIKTTVGIVASMFVDMHTPSL